MATLEISRTEAGPGNGGGRAAPPSLQSFLADLEREAPQEIVHVHRPVDARWEVTALATQLEKAKRFPVLVFHDIRVEGEPTELPLVTYLLASRGRVARALGTDIRHAGAVCYARVQQRQPPVLIAREEAPIKEVVQTGTEVDLRRLPALWHHTTDPGRYITAGLFLTYNRFSERDNSAFHRAWIADRDELRIFLSPNTHNNYNYLQYKEAGEDMPCAYWVGHHPLALIGAETHVGPDESHYEAAGGALESPLRLVPSETLGASFLVPADAEVVIEGYLLKDRLAPEAPFGEYTRYVGPERLGPVMKVTAITRRKAAYWDDVMVGHPHWISSLTKEGAALHALRRVVPGVTAVHVPQSGTGVTHVYVQMKKVVEGQGKTAAIAALNSYFEMKHAWVFDEDVDIFDETEVMLAFAMRFQGDRGLVRLKGVAGSPLDPSSPDGVTVCKTGFDCTKPLGKPFPERVAVPDEVLQRVKMEDFIGGSTLDHVPFEPWG